MRYCYYRPELNTKEWGRVTKDLRSTLSLIRNGSCTSEELRYFCRMAAGDAKELYKDPDMVFWGYDEPYTMPSDIRCEYFFKPSYLMNLCLMSAALNVPDIMDDSAVRTVIHKGLNGCTARGLNGHGIDSEKVLFENLYMFMTEGYPDFALRYPSVSPAFRGMVAETVRQIRSDYVAGRHIFGWNEDMREAQRKVISATPGHILGEYECGSGERFYVAYGSNMARKRMAERCPDAELVGIGIIKGFQLDFFLYATVMETADQTSDAPVAVWKISERDEHTLDRYEGVSAHYYRKDTVHVYLNTGVELDGLIYVMERFRAQPVTKEYYNLIAESYADLGLSGRKADILETALDRNNRRINQKCIDTD